MPGRSPVPAVVRASGAWGAPLRARVRRRRIAVLGLAASVSLAPGPAAGQESGTLVGLSVGVSRTEQRWKPEQVVAKHDGLLIGAFVDVPTPAAGLSVFAEGAYAARGGDVVLDVGGQPTPGVARVGYLSMTLHLRLSGTVGPVGAYFGLGPTVDQVLTSRLDAVLAQALDEERPQVGSLSASAGVRVSLPRNLRLDLDGRIVEGLTDAHVGSFTSVRNRSVEGVIRLGVPLSSLRDR